MDFTRIMQWASIVMCLVAIGMNIYTMVRNRRVHRELMNQVRIWKARNKYAEENGDTESPN